MKKLLLLSVCAIALSSCGEMKKNNEALKAQNDSLNVALAERDAELGRYHGSF